MMTITLPPQPLSLHPNRTPQNPNPKTAPANLPPAVPLRGSSRPVGPKLNPEPFA